MQTTSFLQFPSNESTRTQSAKSKRNSLLETATLILIGVAIGTLASSYSTTELTHKAAKTHAAGDYGCYEFRTRKVEAIKGTASITYISEAFDNGDVAQSTNEKTVFSRPDEGNNRIKYNQMKMYKWAFENYGDLYPAGANIEAKKNQVTGLIAKYKKQLDDAWNAW
jgi:hypothetical protein